MDFRAWEAYRIACEVQKKKKSLHKLIMFSTNLFFALKPLYVDKTNRQIEKLERDIMLLGFDKVVISQFDEGQSYIVWQGKYADPFNPTEMNSKFFQSLSPASA